MILAQSPWTPDVGLVATGHALPADQLPGTRLNNREWAALVRNARALHGHGDEGPCDADFPESRVGVLERRVLDEGVSLREMAASAAADALKKSGVDPADVALVLVTSVTPECQVPAVACCVQKDLGLPEELAAYDLHLGCNGFLGALDVAQRMLASLPEGRCALVVAAEAMLRVVDAGDRRTSPIFGDGAGAALLQRGRGSRFGEIETRTIGERAEAIQISPRQEATESILRFVSRDGETRIEQDLASPLRVVMDGRRVYRDMTKILPGRIRAYLDARGIGLDSIDRFAFHQANRRLVEAVARHPDLEVPEECLLWNIGEVANTGSASIPILLDQARERGDLEPDHRVLLVGFGTGYSLGITFMERSSQ